MVKKTVNQDDVSAYHLFYGDERGRAGTEMTFFDWSFAGQHVPGAGMISATSFRVPGREALDWWAQRFDQALMVLCVCVPCAGALFVGDCTLLLPQRESGTFSYEYDC